MSFLVLLGTGLSLYLPSLASIVGNRLLFRQIHIEAAIIFIFGPIIVARLGNWGSVKEDIKQTDLGENTDFQWLRRIGRKLNPVLGIGRFNAGQKLNSIFTIVTGSLFLVTGVIMWQNPRFPQWFVENAIFLHDALTWLVLVVWLGHFYFAAFHPATRESLRGMTLGWVK
ncbi:MAG: cytochrome b/b6 domain-containing protein, partial [Dehalococcoidia bacterium]|nr:cytochrome b/b6 domain-containing protein [Dehalococcoidia bacterium]